MSREIIERLAIASYNHARDRAAKQKVVVSPWNEASKGMQDAHRSIAERYLPEIKRLLAQEREPMECGHPKACLVPGHFFIAMKPCNKPYDVYACEICGQQMHSHTDGGGTARIMDEYCSACDEREKVREMCAETMEGLQRDDERGDPWDMGYNRATRDGTYHIRQLDLTALGDKEGK